MPLRNDVAANWWRRPIRGGAGLPRPSFSFAYYIKGLRPFIRFFQQTFVEHLLCAEEEKVVARAHTHTHTVLESDGPEFWKCLCGFLNG